MTGHNLYFAGGGAVLDVASASAEQCLRWGERVRRACAMLGWPEAAVVARAHRGGASLAFAAPEDQLFTATEANEWAWLGVAVPADEPTLPRAPGYPSPFDEASAFQTLRRMAAAERSPALSSLLRHATQRQLSVLHDEEGLTLGSGEGGRTWPADALPAAVDWTALSDVPTALVTGSNGKTTTVRLLAAMLSASGRRPGYNCTDGVFIAGDRVERGDWSGPAGARRVLRDARVQAAVLETARGGILRRGLAVRRADAAIVTNVSEDHFGEYGIHDLGDLAEVKLAVARAIGSDGLLVLNADDEVLLEKSAMLRCPLAWFALDDAHPRLRAHRQSGGATCGVAAGRLRLSLRGQAFDLGDIAAMPLTVNASAGYNIANLAGAALLAAALGVSAGTIAEVCARFGARRGDNPGRLERWEIGGVRLLVDYAHNPEGLDGLLGVAQALRGVTPGRLGLLLGQAGNREDEAIRELARVASRHRPDAVILKDLEGYLRGRASGEVPALLQEELLRSGFDAARMRTVLPELDAAKALFDWARPGDVLVLPVHSLAAREALAAWLDARA